MYTRRMTRFLLIALAASGVYGQTPAEQVVMEFQGHQVTLMKPALDDNGFAEESAQVCFDVASKSQCYTPQHGSGSGWGPDLPIGLLPELTPMNLSQGRSALLFTVFANYGGSGSTFHYALLRPGNGREIENLLPPDLILSEISEQAFWSDPSISDAPIFVTADFVWDSDGHFSDHRFTISAYVLETPFLGLPDSFSYALDDRYMTVRKYPGLNADPGDPDATAGVLNSEKPEILARLKRVKAERIKAEAERQAKSPR
jgi:hypothetical protein